MAVNTRGAMVVMLMMLVTTPECRAQGAQDSSAGASAAEAEPVAPVASLADATGQPPGGKRVFGVLPNYRTADMAEIGNPLSVKRKLTIARKDSFDYPLIMLGGVFASFGQLTNSSPSFGQGMKGFGHRLATNYADQAIGNVLAEGVYPSLLHQDPRYFRMGSGSWRHRAAYAVTRVIITQKDGGGRQFNYSEWLGNASAVAISNAYYPDNRNVTYNTTKLFTQVGTDAASQILKEFWPDIRHKVFHK